MNASATHLRSIRLADPDPAALGDFYVDTWGLTHVETTDGVVYLRGNGIEHHALAIEPGSARHMATLSFAAHDADAVDAVAERVRESGIDLIDGPGTRDEPGGGWMVRFADPEGRVIEVSAGVTPHESELDTSGPTGLSHVVLNSVDPAASRRFFVDVLGFVVSDWYENDLMVFLRCNPVHHCVVFQPNEFATVNHVAFEVDTVDDVMKAMGRLGGLGLEPVWGPGRHGPGGNVFCYFADPAGTVIEYTAELFEVDDSWEAREWKRTPQNADQWGTGGGITDLVKALMRNPPTDLEPTR